MKSELVVDSYTIRVGHPHLALGFANELREVLPLAIALCERGEVAGE